MTSSTSDGEDDEGGKKRFVATDSADSAEHPDAARELVKSDGGEAAETRESGCCLSCGELRGGWVLAACADTAAFLPKPCATLVLPSSSPPTNACCCSVSCATAARQAVTIRWSAPSPSWVVEPLDRPTTRTSAIVGQRDSTEPELRRQRLRRAVT